MKTKLSILKVLIIPIFLAVLASGCKEKESETSLSAFVFDRDASYALGMTYGNGMREYFKEGNLIPNYDEFVKGYTAALHDKKTRFTADEAEAILDAAHAEFTEKRMAEFEQEENAFLAENSKKNGITTTPSGLQYEVVTRGTGRTPSEDNVVKVHYNGTYADGTPFDSSYARNAPLEIEVNDALFGSGWAEGLQLMTVGSNYILYIPSALAFGPQGLRDFSGREIVRPFATLVFDIELIEIVK